MSKYLKIDSELGYIEEPTLIEYAKFNNLRHTILGFMMGDFDSNGKYYIDPTIVAQLISMRKHIIEVDENIEVCHGELRLDKPFTFVITYEKDRVALSILEKLNFEANYKLNSGAYSNINEYVLDEIETSGIVDRNLIYKEWNVDTFGGREIDIFSCDDSVLEKYFGIINRFKYLLKANSIFIDKETELEEIEAEYGNRMLDLLSLYPELKKIVEAEILKSIKDKKDFISINKLFFAKTINEVLDKAIEENVNILSEEYRAQFNKDRLNITRDTNIKREMTINTKSITINDGKTDEKLDSTRIQQIDTHGEELTKTVVELAEEFSSKEKEALENYQKGTEKEKFTKVIDNISGGLLIPKMTDEKQNVTDVKPNLVTKKTDDLMNNKSDKSKTAKSGSGKSGAGQTRKAASKQERKTNTTREGQDQARQQKTGSYIPYSIFRDRGSNDNPTNNKYDQITKTRDVNARMETARIDNKRTAGVDSVGVDTSM